MMKTGMTKKGGSIWLSPADRATLEGWISGRNTPQELVWRARIVLQSADRVGMMAIARSIGMSKVTLDRWQERYLAKGIARLRRDPAATQATAECRDDRAGRAQDLARGAAGGLSDTSVQRIWKAHELKPQLAKTFKLSNGKRFVEKTQDIVGLHLDPPDKALVFSMDEKSQIQALDRTRPGLRLKKGRCGSMTHDCKRHGATTLFAALDVATGRVIGQCMSQDRHQEWLKLLRRIDGETPKQLDAHLIADNDATRKHAEARAWLKRHPRFHLHFTPTSASSINQVERFFGLITEDRIRCGVFKSVAERQAAIRQDLEHHHADPKPFVWTASATAILAKLAHGR